MTYKHFIHIHVYACIKTVCLYHRIINEAAYIHRHNTYLKDFTQYITIPIQSKINIKRSKESFLVIAALTDGACALLDVLAGERSETTRKLLTALAFDRVFLSGGC